MENQSVESTQNVGNEPIRSEPMTYEEKEKDLNSRILKTTMTIKDNYPELSKYLDEMPVTVPSETDNDITLKHLSTYYESLNSLLNKYKSEHPK